MLLHTTGFCSFLMLNYVPLSVHTTFFVPSSINGHLSYFYILAIMNNAVMSRGGGVQKSPTDVTVFP